MKGEGNMFYVALEDVYIVLQWYDLDVVVDIEMVVDNGKMLLSDNRKFQKGENSSWLLQNTIGRMIESLTLFDDS